MTHLRNKLLRNPETDGLSILSRVVIKSRHKLQNITRAMASEISENLPGSQSEAMHSANAVLAIAESSMAITATANNAIERLAIAKSAIAEFAMLPSSV